MFKPFLLCILVTIFVEFAAAKCPVCPQSIFRDTSSQVCASNTFGTFSLTQSQISNWNCNHPFNKFNVISQLPCPINNNIAICGPNNCINNNGPAICATLNNPRGLPIGSAVFANQCELNYYNCMNPNLKYTANRFSPQLCNTIRL